MHELKRSATLGSSERLSWKCAKLGLPAAIWRDYHEGLVRLIAGARRQVVSTKTVPDYEKIVDRNGDELQLALLLPHREQWFVLIATAIDALRAATSKRLP